jgi:putative membrane protein
MKTFLTGIMVGVANIIPGLSGGTILVLSGLYEDVLSAIKSPFKNILFLSLLGLGVVLGLGSFALTIDFLFEIAEIPLLFFFMGLVIGGALLFYQLEIVIAKEVFRPITVIIAFLGVLLLDFIPAGLLEPSPFVLLTTGFLAGATMILPGLSGALLFLILGQYQIALDLVVQLLSFDLSVLPIVIGLGVAGITGIIVMSIVLSYLFKQQRNLILNIILGLLLGSVYQITPTSVIDWTWLSALISLPLGLYLGFMVPQIKTRR